MKISNNLCNVFRRRPQAVAFVNGSDENARIHGLVRFYEVYGGVLIRAEIEGLPTETQMCAEPIFAFHIHSGSECSGDHEDPFAHVGGHFNPENCPHPYHAGDMPPLFSVNGRAFSVFLTDRFELSEILGKTVIIHSRPDDFTTQPSGNAGEKIACGVITPTAR